MRKNLDARIGRLETAQPKPGNDDERVMATLRALSKIYGDGSEPEAMSAKDFDAMVDQTLVRVYSGISQ